ncbi:hypothetical protein C7M84_003349 [Penaeus vannamei]|uniref:Uncharacterized protein n=1 Tax=Penaeus vannamei TaxID=6689 RepID=A0A3R7MB59_PENVA|nr:uncharacterized protein LOC113803706 [Penaeus vannamei]ROT77975.1 hypothetical protein C7M84_003349 [Penaeus vannamei]
MSHLPNSSDRNCSSQNASPLAPRSVLVERVSAPSVPEQGPRAMEPSHNGFVNNLSARTSRVLPEAHVYTPTACDSTALDLDLGSNFVWADDDLVNEDFDALLDAALHLPPQ